MSTEAFVDLQNELFLSRADGFKFRNAIDEKWVLVPNNYYGLQTEIIRSDQDVNLVLTKPRIFIQDDPGYEEFIDTHNIISIDSKIKIKNCRKVESIYPDQEGGYTASFTSADKFLCVSGIEISAVETKISDYGDAIPTDPSSMYREWLYPAPSSAISPTIATVCSVNCLIPTDGIATTSLCFDANQLYSHYNDACEPSGGSLTVTVSPDPNYSEYFIAKVNYSFPIVSSVLISKITTKTAYGDTSMYDQWVEIPVAGSNFGYGVQYYHAFVDESDIPDDDPFGTWTAPVITPLYTNYPAMSFFGATPYFWYSSSE